jgi:phage anti-repressor protein
MKDNENNTFTSNEIIKINSINFNNEIKQTVSARDLWERLEVKERFNDWIKRQLEDFIENIDYLTFAKKSAGINADYKGFTENSVKPQGGRPAIEYFLTVETAKHLCMLSKTEIGKRIRDYFVECERVAKEQPKANSVLDLFALSVKALRELEAKNKFLEEEQHNQHLDMLKIKNCVNRLLETNDKYMTVIAYANLNKVDAKDYKAMIMGKKAAKLCRERNLLMGSVIDQRYGNIKTYPIEILREIFCKEGLMESNSQTYY